MNDAFEYQGHWWLPGTEGDKVPGILKFDPDAGATLDLLGSFKGLEGIIDPFDPKIILGLSSGGRLITLHDCRQTSGNLAIGRGISTSTFAVNTVLVGEHFGNVEDIGFERLVVEYLYAEAWACATGFKFKFYKDVEESHIQQMEVKHELLEPITSHVGGEYEVSLSFPRKCEIPPVPRTWVNIHQPAELTIKFPQKESFGRLSDIAFRLQHLLSLGMRRSAYPVATLGYTGNPSEATPVDVYYRPLGRTDAPQVRPELYEMLFSRRELP